MNNECLSFLKGKILDSSSLHNIINNKFHIEYNENSLDEVKINNKIKT